MPVGDRTPPRRFRQRAFFLFAFRLALFAAALVALRHEIAGVHRADVVRALRSYRWPHVTFALICTAASFLTLGAMELVATRAAGDDAPRAMPRRVSFATAFVAHAFSQSIGLALLTGAAVRLRAYGRYGVDARAVARTTATVIGAMMLALVSLGVVALAGAPSMLRVRQLALFGWGMRAAVAAIVVSVVVLLYRARRRVSLPPLHIVPALVALSTIDWLLTGAVVAAFVPATSLASYVDIFRAFVVANAAGMASQVPGGAGVLDVTLISLLAPSVPTTTRGTLAAALVAYRVTYYLVPLCAATIAAALGEMRRVRRTSSHPTQPIVRPLASHTRAPAVPTPNAVARTDDSPSPLSREPHSVEWLIDNADAYDALLDAVRSARQSVWITQLAFDADCAIYSRSGSKHTVLADALIALAADSVDVRILLNEHVLQNTVRAFRRYLGTTSRIRVRGVRRFPHFLHVKMVIVDGTDAFLLGSPFVNGYWDDARHAPADARRPNRELSGRPLHDVSLRVRGPVVRRLESHFVELWNDAGAPAAPDAIDEDPVRLTHARCDGDAGEHAVRMVRTLPRRALRDAPHGATEVLDALLDGVARARSLIYIEHQYLTARHAVAALVTALRRERDLEVVVVMNQNPDLTAYRGWQNARLAESGLLAHPRVGIFALWSAAPSCRPGIAAINQVFVHSKVVTIDDAWALVGAANLDGLSLHSYGDDFTGRAARRVFRHVRNFEVSLLVRAADGSVGAVTDLRTRLWSEHLGVAPSDVAVRPPEGWLAQWRAYAAENVRSLSPGADPARERPTMRGFVLPYSTRPTPAQQLADVGVRVDPARLALRFDPGWFEVHLSAGWVRNIFA